jgi:hypothetical protein
VRRVPDLIRVLGPAGIIGLGVLLACAAFYVSAVRPAEVELNAQRLAADRLRTRNLLQTVPTNDPASELRRFYGLFPVVSRLPDELERLYGLAHGASLELPQAEYRMEPQAGGLIPYRVTLPVRGTYAQIREFMSGVLQSMPIASIDALRFERKKVGETRLDAQLRLTIYLQASTDLEEPQARTSPP